MAPGSLTARATSPAVRSLDHRNRRVLSYALLAALAMLGLGFAAVPLYNMFCSATGFGGTTQRATEAQADEAEQLARGAARSAGVRTFSIRFDSNTALDVPWTFHPLQVTDTVAIGQRDMAIFVARNNSDEAVTGTASFNVEPEQAGIHFNKIQCFCFTEQTLQPGQEVRMPVLYYVDPAARDDPAMKDVQQITLSYTFHRVKAGTAIADAPQTASAATSGTVAGPLAGTVTDKTKG